MPRYGDDRGVGYADVRDALHRSVRERREDGILVRTNDFAGAYVVL